MLYLNDRIVEFGSFPNGEFNLPIKDLIIKAEKNHVKFVYEDNTDLVKLLILRGWLGDMTKDMKSILSFSYLPYSRMDRANGHYAPSLRYISGFINSLGFSKVILRDPHSDISLKLIANSESFDWCKNKLEDAMFRGDFTSVHYPDDGAKNRFSIPGKLPLSNGKKIRDFLTGQITSTEITGEVTNRVLIVDDMCSKGGTFVNAAKLLKSKGAIHIGLLVAYCEDTVLTGELFDYIDVLYTSTDCKVDHPRIIKFN